MTSWHPDYLIFNDSIIGESYGSPEFATLRLQNETSEARRAFRDTPLWSIDLSNILLSAQQYEELLAFQWDVQGMLNPFLVRNARNYLFENAAGAPSLLGIGDGVTTQFQLVKNRATQGRHNFETILFPNFDYPPLEDLNGDDWEFLPELQITVDGVPIAKNLLTVDRSLGLVTLPFVPTVGQRIEATGGFYTLMVANSDAIPVKLEGGVYRVQQGITFSEPAGGE